MSRIGKKLIKIPTGVTVSQDTGVVTVKGPKSQLKYEFRPEMEVFITGDEITINEKIQTKASNAFWGLTRALIANMIEGVTNGFKKRLQLVGVGFRVKKDSDTQLTLTLGFSHPVIYKAPDGITFDVEGNDIIIVNGCDSQQVGLVAAKIKKLRKPEPYKGKGIRYEGEVVRRKAGKTGKA
ncbi:50S ribosomal protein L6 [candidate division WWE3 bacterium]|nr:50S ribosomal protein L6 [candidate division WWE3 bacterium]